MKSKSTKSVKFTFFKKHKKIAILLVCVVLFISALTFINYSRYAIDIVRNYYLKSRKFYFNSNRLVLVKPQTLLSEEKPTEALSGKSYDINPWIVNDEPYEISITMNSKLNNTTMMDVDLKYNVSCSVAFGPNMKNHNVEVPTCEIKESGTHQTSMDRFIPGSKYEQPEPTTEGEKGPIIEKNIDHFNVVITPPGGNQLKDGDEVIVKITAKATSPYTQTLDATFNLIVGQYGVTYEIDDEIGRRYLDFIVTNKKPDQMMIVELTIAEKNTIIFDQNNAILDTIKKYSSENPEYGYGVYKDENGIIEKIIFPVASKSSNLVRFYKTAGNVGKDFSYKSNSYGENSEMSVLAIRYFTEDEYKNEITPPAPAGSEPTVSEPEPATSEAETTPDPAIDTSEPQPTE